MQNNYEGHTPEPWVITRYTNYIGYAISGGHLGCFAERWYKIDLTEEENKELEANINLIVDAPTLLRKLQAAETALDEYGVHKATCAVYKRTDEMIERGETPACTCGLDAALAEIRKE